MTGALAALLNAAGMRRRSIVLRLRSMVASPVGSNAIARRTRVWATAAMTTVPRRSPSSAPGAPRASAPTTVSAAATGALMMRPIANSRKAPKPASSAPQVLSQMSGKVSVLATPNTTSASLVCAIRFAYRGLKATRMAVATRPTKNAVRNDRRVASCASDRDVRAAAAARVPTSAGAYPATVAAVFPMVCAKL